MHPMSCRLKSIENCMAYDGRKMVALPEDAQPELKQNPNCFV